MKHIHVISIIFLGAIGLISIFLTFYLKDTFFIVIGALLMIALILLFGELRRNRKDPSFH